MIQFLFKGILRDKNRSLLPVIVITIGVSLTVLLSGYLRGVMGDIIDQNARFETGHVRIMTKPYALNKDQLPNDLALLGVEEMTQSLNDQFPDYQWVKRIRFGGLIDAPDEQGQSKGQGPSAGLAIELFSEGSGEIERFNILHSIVSGRLPQEAREALIGDEFAQKLELKTGDEITYLGTTMNGSMTMESFTICGTIRFGFAAMDKGAVIIDVSDAQQMLDMADGAGEILGFSREGVYFDEKAQQLTETFNAQYVDSEDEFAPVMKRLKEQNNLAGYLDYVDSFSALLVIIFICIMSVVLWNTGLIGGLRRYQEFGIRLALGEEKGHLYRSLLTEAVLVGIIGSIVGTVIGLTGVLYLQIYGIDISGMFKGGTMMMPSVVRAKFTPDLLFIGFIPGLIAMVIGNMLSGIGIYKRETARLFHELEV